MPELNVNFPASFWKAPVICALLALAFSFMVLPLEGVFSLGLGLTAGLIHVFLLRRLLKWSLTQLPGKALIIKVMIKFYISFILTAVILAGLAYNNLVAPLLFGAGFIIIMLTLFGWGISRIIGLKFSKA